MILRSRRQWHERTELIKLVSESGHRVRGMLCKQPDHANEPLPGVDSLTAHFDQPETIRRA